MCVKPLQKSSSINIKAWNLSLWHDCAPQGSFVSTGAPCGFCDAKSLHVDPIYVCPTAAKCHDPLLSKRHTFCYGRTVPHRAHSSLLEQIIVLWCKISNRRPLYVQLVQNVSIILDQSLKLIVMAGLCIRRHDSFVLTGAPCGFCNAKLQNIDPIYVCPTAAKCHDPLLSKRQTYCYGRPVPHRAHSSLMDLIVVSVVQNPICRPFYVYETPAKCLHQ